LSLAAELFAESIRDTMVANSDPDEAVFGGATTGSARPV
jgi:hypothetical protein